MSDEQQADRVITCLRARDPVAQWFGMDVTGTGAGRADVEMTVEAHHCNGHGICHGGITFTLADTAFAYACNSRNQNTLAQHNTITYLAPARLGDTLRASAVEVSLKGRTGLYDVSVINQRKEPIAAFRGASRAVPGKIIEDEEDTP